MTGGQKPKQAPDGEPAPRTRDTESTTKSRVLEVQYPIIAGDVGGNATVDAGEVSVDDADRVKPKNENLDLPH